MDLKLFYLNYVYTYCIAYNISDYQSIDQRIPEIYFLSQYLDSPT